MLNQNRHLREDVLMNIYTYMHTLNYIYIYIGKASNSIEATVFSTVAITQ